MFDLLSSEGLVQRNWCRAGVKPEHEAILLKINNNYILLANTGSSSWMELRQIQKQLALQGIRGAWFATDCPVTPPGEHPIWDTGMHILSGQDDLFYEEGPDGFNWLNASKQLPVFQYKPATSTSEEQIIVAGLQIPFNTFIQKLLNGNIRFCSQARLTGEGLVFVRLFVYPCWKCNQKSWIYVLNKFTDRTNTDQNLLTCCGQQVELEWVHWQTNLAFHLQTIEIMQYIITHNFSAYPLSTIKERYSKTAGDTYLSFGCPKCDSLFGQFFVEDLRQLPIIEENNDCFWINLSFNQFPLVIDEQRHWCYSETKTFCQA